MIEKVIHITVSIIAALIIATLIFAGTKYGRQLSDAVLSKITDMVKGNVEEDYTEYIGKTVTGYEAVFLIKQWQPHEICVMVKTKSGNVTQYNYTASKDGIDGKIDKVTNDLLIAKCTQKNSKNYINPDGRFICKAVTDQNGEYYIIYFIQK